MPSIYPVYGEEGETMEHTLFLCYRASLVWRLAGFDILFTHVTDYVDTFLNLIRPISTHPCRTLLAYIAYHLWLSRNAFAFDSGRPSARLILERAHIYAQDFLSLTAVTSENWDFCSAPRAPCQVFIS